MTTIKNRNAKAAEDWLSKISNSESWRYEIDKSVKNTFIRRITPDCKRSSMLTREELNLCSGTAELNSETVVTIVKGTTYDVLLSLVKDNVYEVAALNFASYFNPGGGFEKGSEAQEESLCHVSGLYPVLNKLSVYNIRRRRHDVPFEYDSELIYSKDVPFAFERGNIESGIFGVDIVSCAAPNRNRGQISDERAQEVIAERIEGIYLLPYVNRRRVLVLGAWGCGVFKNDPMMIANEFKKLIQKYPGIYDMVIFAVPNEEMYNTFSNVIYS